MFFQKLKRSVLLQKREEALSLLPAIRHYVDTYDSGIRYFDEVVDDYAYEPDETDEHQEEEPWEEDPPSQLNKQKFFAEDGFGVTGSVPNIGYGGYRKEENPYASVRSFLERNRAASFSCKVDELISQRNLRYPAVYKAANLDRRLFSKMMSDIHYQPSKDTAIAVALALHLNLEQANDLLSRAGYALSPSTKRDIIIEFFFLHEKYDLIQINIALDEMGEHPIGN